MVIGLLKWLKETRFYEKKKKDSYKDMSFVQKGKCILRRKGECMNFWRKESLILQISRGKRRSFSTQKVGRKEKLARYFKR